MSLSPEERSAVLTIRMQNAAEALEDASVLLARGSLRGSANRLYYAAFHAVSALALSKGSAMKAHRGIIAFFYAQFIQTAILNARFGVVLQKVFEERSEADYEDDVCLDGQQLSTRLAEVGELVAEIRHMLAAAKT